MLITLCSFSKVICVTPLSNGRHPLCPFDTLSAVNSEGRAGDLRAQLLLLLVSLNLVAAIVLSGLWQLLTPLDMFNVFPPPPQYFTKLFVFYFEGHASADADFGPRIEHTRRSNKRNV